MFNLWSDAEADIQTVDTGINVNFVDANFAFLDTHTNVDHVEADANTDPVDADGYADHVVGIRSNDWIFSGRPGHRSWH